MNERLNHFYTGKIRNIHHRQICNVIAHDVQSFRFRIMMLETITRGVLPDCREAMAVIRRKR